MEILFTVIAVLYFIIHLFLLSGLIKSLKLKKNDTNALPALSVSVAGRNAECNIKDCIKSLSELTYPEGLLEIILVNDNSSDRTFEIMKEETKNKSFFKVISSVPDANGILKGKANAIDNAIQICKGDVILSTDADCIVKPDWAVNTVRYYSGNTGMVCGFTKMREEDSLFGKIQSLDWIYLLTLAAASSGLDMILSCIGNNLSFSKETYFYSGGYRSIKFSVTEDLALMRKIYSDKKFEIKFPVDKGCLVTTIPCKNISELISQKRRWFRGGTDVNLFGYIVGFELYMINILFIFGIFFLSLKLYLILIFIKILSEIILLIFVLNKLDLKSYLKIYPFFIFYFAVIGILLPLSFVSGKKIKWKGQRF